MWCCLFFFFFNDTATTEIYTLSLHDALPILKGGVLPLFAGSPDRAARLDQRQQPGRTHRRRRDRKSTRLNSSHLVISYAVFCLKKKKKTKTRLRSTPRYSTPGDECYTTPRR